MTSRIAETSAEGLAAASRRLGTDLTKADVEQALERAGLGPGEQIEQVEPLSGGNVNALFEIRRADGSRWVLKLGHPIFRSGKLSNEARALVAFRELGLPVPRLLHHEARGETLPVDWLVLEHVEGRPLGEMLAQGGIEAIELAAEAGRHLATIHGQEGPAFGVPGEDGSPGPIPWFGKADPAAPRGPFPTFADWLDAEVREQVAGIGEDARFVAILEPLTGVIRTLGGAVGALRPGRVHGDFTAANLLVGSDDGGRPRIVALFDCEWSHFGARELERAWAEESFAESLCGVVRPSALERFRKAFDDPALSPEVRRLAGAIRLLYELNAFDWIAHDWPEERRRDELDRRIEAVRELCRGDDVAGDGGRAG